MAKAPTKRKIRICMWLPEDLHARLLRAAEVDDRTMAGFTVAALRRVLDEFEASKTTKKR